MVEILKNSEETEKKVHEATEKALDHITTFAADGKLVLDVGQIDDVNKSSNTYILKNYKGFIVLMIVLLVLCVYALFRFNIGPMPLFAVIAVFGLVVMNVKRKFKKQFTQQFGASIGFTYQPTTVIDSTGCKLLNAGHGQEAYDVLVGIHEGFPMSIFTYRFTIGSGKNSHTYHYTVFEVTLNEEVPNILLYSKSCDSAVSDFFSGNETVNLEGNFHEHFKLRVPKGYEMQAYQIFTPNVMEDLIDRAKDYSFEFVRNKLYIYATDIVTKREKMNEMFALVTYLDDLFRRNARGVDM